MSRIVDEHGYDLYPDWEEPEEDDYEKDNFIPVIHYHIQNYTCENGKLAKFVIPEDATFDDLAGFKELLDVVIKRKFKVCGDAEGIESCEGRKNNG